MSSPPPGRSTLITSAPRSPSVIAANGPASTREKSATSSPSSGPAESAIGGSLVSEPMRTLVVSDLHLGSTRGADLLRRPELREPLLEEVARHDRLVILGDALELREAPQRDAAEIAAPVFADLGARSARTASC